MDAAAPQGLRAQLTTMWAALLASPVRRSIALLYLGVGIVIVATAFGQVLLNRWNQPFYDSLERRDLAAFFDQLTVFAYIAGSLLVLNVGQAWLNQMLHIKMREGLTRDLIGEWMKPRRAFRLGYVGEIGVNPDQRMHEDSRHLADLTVDLSIGLMQATILLASFVGVLWSISNDFTFSIGGRSIDIPGYMVWAAFLYAGLGSGLSWLAGRPLIRLNEARYAREAELRFSLMRVNEHVDAISLAGGEADERTKLERDLQTVLGAARRIMSAAVRLTWVTAGYGWITVVAPIVIASPVYFSGRLSFGGLMVAAAAFNQVNGYPAVHRLQWFNHGFMKAEQQGDRLLLSDLRMGNEPDYTFRFAIAERDGESWREIAPEQLEWSANAGERLPAMWQRIWNEPAIVADVALERHVLERATAMRAKVHSDTLK